MSRGSYRDVCLVFGVLSGMEGVGWGFRFYGYKYLDGYVVVFGFVVYFYV